MRMVTKIAWAWMARCNSCRAPLHLPAGTEVALRMGKPDVDCPSCGGSMHAKMIKGSVSEAPCNAKCEASKGHVCECSCGGVNHGASHAA